jgi:hypothetical protein
MRPICPIGPIRPILTTRLLLRLRATPGVVVRGSRQVQEGRVRRKDRMPADPADAFRLFTELEKCRQ